MLRRVEASLALGAVMLIILTMPAHAYMDPGTGALILQILVGGIAGGAMVLKLYWQQFKRGLSRVTGRDTDPEDLSVSAKEPDED